MVLRAKKTTKTKPAKKYYTDHGLSYREILAKIVATFFWVGKIKYAPGTCGSIAGAALFYYLQFEHGTSLKTNLTIIGLMFLVGWWASAVYAKSTKKQDPKEVVIDEVVGQMLVIALVAKPVSYFITYFLKYAITMESELAVKALIFGPMILIPFIVFRLFDILKPWPIKWFDKNVKGGLGIMIDDIVAALASIATIWGLFYIIART